MGISRNYVHDLFYDPDGSMLKARRNKYSKPCPQCGTLMSGSSGRNSPRNPKLCASCSHQAQRDGRKWTREKIIEAIQLFAEKNGRPPLSSEWLQGEKTRGEEYPPASAVYSYFNHSRNRPVVRPFATWADAIEAAGFPRPRQGAKVLPFGQGASQMPVDWIVFVREDEDTWKSYETHAASADIAVEKVAFREGEYFPIRKSLFNVKNTVPKQVFEVMKSTPGGNES